MVFMTQRKRSRLSPTQETDVWKRWKAGETLHEIGRAFDKPHTSIRHLLLPRGGIAPRARRRSGLALTLAEREDISRGIASGTSIREIARHLDRAASTVCREEVTCHSGRPAYRAHEADDQAWESALRPKKCLLALRRCRGEQRCGFRGPALTREVKGAQGHHQRYEASAYLTFPHKSRFRRCDRKKRLSARPWNASMKGVDKLGMILCR